MGTTPPNHQLVKPKGADPWFDTADPQGLVRPLDALRQDKAEAEARIGGLPHPNSWIAHVYMYMYIYIYVFIGVFFLLLFSPLSLSLSLSLRCALNHSWL